MKGFVTLSASYGARGAEIGPTLAERLGVPFFDRAVPVAVAERLGLSVDDPLLLEERPTGFWERLLAGFSSISQYGTADMPLPSSDIVTEQDYRVEVDRTIRRAADGEAGGVLLGRAGAVVLAGHPRAVHVRLDAPRSRRIQRVCEEFGIDVARATEQLQRTDALREAYVKKLYGVDAKDPGLYDLVIDSTSISAATSVELIVVAVQARVEQLAAAVAPS